MKNIKFLSVFLVVVVAACNPSASTSSPGQGATVQSDPTQTKISWSAALGEQQGFYVEESTDGINFSRVQVVPNGTNTAIVSGLLPGHTYSFRVRAYNQVGNSPYTATVVVSR